MTRRTTTKKSTKSFAVTDLSRYPEIVAKFKELSEKLTPEEYEKIVAQFDERQRKRWEKHLIKTK